ncbi:hypothetical protein PC114_g25138 [Phytophthora cactorum]|nr:hypothetical protein PC114_g25138 [Phytophthora cactorum]KAG3141482.1 hypothetical protein PC128_g24980 [Phytophthora cactorum]
MPRGKQLSEEECRKIDMHVRERKSNRAIAKLLGRDEKAIRNYLRLGKASSATKRTGRKPKLTEREVRRVFRLAISNGLSANQGEDSAVGEASVGEEDDQTSPPNGGSQVSSRRLRQ